MDIAVANLLKHKTLFKVVSYGRSDEHPNYRTFRREYISMDIENAQSIGVNGINELCQKCLEPFMIHAISRVATEETEHIDFITVYAELYENDPRDIIS